MESRYYSQTPEQVLAAVESREEGLTSRQAQERLERFGPNALREEKKKPVWQVFLEQFKDLLVVILIAAAVISMLSGNVESTIVIFAVLILNAVLGTVQHCKAEKSLESLKAMSAPHRPGAPGRRAAGDPLRPDRPRRYCGAGGGGYGGGRRPHSA